MNNVRIPFRLSALAIALLATACGGGGGGGGGDDDFDGATSSGSAGKGIIVGGAVEALEIKNGAFIPRGTTTTNAAGQYSLSLTEYTGGPLVIQIKGGGSATMKCDVQAGCGEGVSFGQALPLASTFLMRTVMPTVPSDGELARCISPFTELAVQRAIDAAGGSLNNVSSAQANAALSEVSQLVGGIDVLRTCVVDLTNPTAVDDAPESALALSGLSAAVLAVGGSADPEAAMASLDAAFDGGDIAAEDLQELLTAATTELQAVSEGSETNVAYLAMADDIEDAGPGGIVNPEPSPGSTANLAAVEKGKALIGQVRSLALNLTTDVRDGESQPVVSAFADQLDAAADAVETTQVGSALGLVLDEVSTFYESLADGSGSSGTTFTSIDSAGATQTATISVNKPATGNHSVTVTGRVRDFTANLSLSAPANPQAGGTAPRDFSAVVNGTFESASGVGVRATLQGSAGVDDLTYSEVLDRWDGASAVFDGTATFAQIGISNPFSFSGEVSMRVADCTACSTTVTRPDGVVDSGEAINLDRFSLEGIFSNNEATFEASVSVDMDTTATTNYDIRLPVSANNVPSGKVSVQVDAVLDGFHTYGVALVAELDDINSLVDNDDGVDFYNVDAMLTASLRRDDSTLLITAISQPPTNTSNVIDLIIRNQSGDAIWVDNLTGSGSIPAGGRIMVDDKQIGTIEETDRGVVIIRWTDGTFETLG